MPLTAKELERFRDFEDAIKDEIVGLGSEASFESALLKVFEPILVEQGDSQEILLVSHEDTTGRNRCKFDGYCLNESVDRIDLFIGYYVKEKDAQVSWSDIEKVAYKAARTLRYAANEDFERFNGEAKDAVETISKELQRSLRISSTFHQIVVNILTNNRHNRTKITSKTYLDRP